MFQQGKIYSKQIPYLPFFSIFPQQEIFLVTKRSVFAVDARNHGESPHTNVMSYSTMAKDVECFAKQMKSPKVSFIGKCWLLFSLLNGQVIKYFIWAQLPTA